MLILAAVIISATGYIAYDSGYRAGRNYTQQFDSDLPKKWVSKKWGYEVTFPWSWDNLKRDDPSILSMGADIFCGNRRGASTAVFVYPFVSGDTLDKLAGEILAEYEKQVGPLTIIEQKVSTTGGFPLRTVIFSQGQFKHHYTFIQADKINLAVSSNCPGDEYDAAVKDFEEIINSIRFIR